MGDESGVPLELGTNSEDTATDSLAQLNYEERKQGRC